MKQYLITEEELKRLYAIAYADGIVSDERLINVVSELLKPKKEVKEVYTLTPVERISFSRFKYKTYKVFIEGGKT